MILLALPRWSQKITGYIEGPLRQTQAAFFALQRVQQ